MRFFLLVREDTNELLKIFSSMSEANLALQNTHWRCYVIEMPGVLYEFPRSGAAA